ncbi:OB-fold domain-containing protein [uncultured Albimonas sp.]|uniref:Zn-ribbon domain-containing OB-fold protein n=1 Tax=uncultured Albimonas sp. TaxID=1331701 RepID=UPI0030ED7FB0|tara:strand:- start:2289 stop:2666 length:378 start_codon:yes stop_codon:yes gene_type:complete
MITPSESPEAAYRAALEAGRFQVQRCADCSAFAFPPRVVCPTCGSGALEWRASAGIGAVHSCTVVNRRAEAGGPYNVVLVDLEEGVRLMSHVVGFGAQEVPLDLRVRAQIAPEDPRLTFRAEDAE